MIFYIFLTLILQLISSEASCPEGTKAHGGNCYYFSHDNEEWTEAMYVCQNFLHGNLVEIHSKEENSFLAQFAVNSTYGYFIGANDIYHEGTWVWASSRSNLTYSNWALGEPNNYKKPENCATIQHDGTWLDVPCNAPMRYICDLPEM